MNLNSEVYKYIAKTFLFTTGIIIVLFASIIFIEVIYVYNALSKPRLIIDPKVKIRNIIKKMEKTISFSSDRSS